MSIWEEPGHPYQISERGPNPAPHEAGASMFDQYGGPSSNYQGGLWAGGGGGGGTTWSPPSGGTVNPTTGEATFTRGVLGAGGGGGGGGGGISSGPNTTPQTGGAGIGGSYFGPGGLSYNVGSNLGPTSSQYGLPQGLFSGLGSPLTPPGMSGPPGDLGAGGPVQAGALASGAMFPRLSAAGNWVRTGYFNTMPVAQWQAQNPGQPLPGNAPVSGTSGGGTAPQTGGGAAHTAPRRIQ